ncbi:MAG: hypothetical protein WKF87_11010 [Chryseolinea sp.]
MTTLQERIGVAGRRIFRVVLGYADQFETTSDNCDYFGQQASDLIKDALMADAPFAVSRFGHGELRALLTYLHIQENTPDWEKLLRYVKGEKVEPWWHRNTTTHITYNAGIFPNSTEIIEEYCRLILKEMPNIDILGSWLGGERWIKHMLPHSKFMRFHDFYHFLHENPWTSALEGKRVVVIHPFAKSIENQYTARENVFTAPHTLPKFDLITYRAVQSIAGNNPEGFTSWFDALNAMKEDIAKLNFDVAIIGCGAYGMPLATYIKVQLGKKAIHLGGNTQILFGIKGNRWTSDPNFKHIFNRYWAQPLAEETPTGHGSIDNNCYW